MEDDPVVGEEFADALGGEKVGEITENGTWRCLECGATGHHRDRMVASLLLHAHRGAIHG